MKIVSTMPICSDKYKPGISKNHIWKIPAYISLNILAVFSAILMQIQLTDIVILGNALNINELIENVFIILLASIIGSSIGWERESRNRPAGLRTYALVCVGSALVMITSYKIFNEYSYLGNFDPARLGAQVISGIGFLGAGTIIRDKFSVKGLTTAASLWVVACLGLAIGAKMYLTSIIISMILYYILHNLRCLEDIKSEKMNYEILIRIKDEQVHLREINQILDKYRINLRDINVGYNQAGLLETEEEDIAIMIHAMIMDQAIDSLIVDLNSIKGITSFSFSEI